MAIFRILLAAAVSLGLSLAPAVAAMPAAKAPAAAAAMDDCPHHKGASDAAIKTGAPCPSGGGMSECGAALCALKCFKVVALFAAPARQRLIAPASGEASLPEALVSITSRPSTPPPRS